MTSFYDYYSTTQNQDSDSGKPFWLLNGFEWIMVVISLLLLVGVGLWGFFGQQARNRDAQREFDIAGIMVPALQDFYKNSAATESARFYPVSRCSSDLNEVDFEFVLRQHLTGELPEIDQHVYIQPKNYPKDRAGVYSDTFSQRQVEYRCPEKLNFTISGADRKIYQDYPSCNFQYASSLSKCYLYTSSATGDTFQIGYYSETTGCFDIYKQFRSQSLEKLVQC